MRLILASISPRRRDLLNTLGLDFEVMPGPRLDEDRILSDGEGSLPSRMEHLAALKGRDVSRANPEALVLSADTVVVLPGEVDLSQAENGEMNYTASVLTKPENSAKAEEMLSSLSGRMHHVITAVALQQLSNNYVKAGWEVTQVYFNELSPEVVDAYVKREQPLDKAGGYAIQGLGALLVQRIEGDYTNVVGLPLGLTARLLDDAGVNVL
jgi:septum formation protein